MSGLSSFVFFEKLHVVQFFVEKIDVVQIAVVHLGLKKELSSSLAVVQIYSPPCMTNQRPPKFSGLSTFAKKMFSGLSL